MTHDQVMPESPYTFSTLAPWMPGTFLVHTITGTMHLVFNDPAGESLMCWIRRQAGGGFVGDSDWRPVTYSEIHVGADACFEFIHSEVYGDDPAHTGERRRTPRVVRIGLYEGHPQFPAPGTFGHPRGLPTSLGREGV